MIDLSKLFDPYGRNARVYPALLTMMPALCVVLAWFPHLGGKNLGDAVVGFLAACGVFYFLADWARSRGKAIEPGLLKAWGGWPTTIWLRHSDTSLPALTKARYHAFLSQGIGSHFPTPEKERRNPALADETYASAVHWLKEQCRGADFSLVEKENATYGFRRNLLGVKATAIAVCGVAAVGSAALLVILKYPPGRPLSWDGTLVMIRASSSLVLGATALCVLAIGAWIVVVSAKWVRAAGDQYARALLACCETLAPRSSAKS